MRILVVKRDFVVGSALLSAPLVSKFAFVGRSIAKLLPVATKGQWFGAFSMSVV